MTENDRSKNSHQNISISFQGRKPLYFQGQNDFALLNVSSLNVPKSSFYTRFNTSTGTSQWKRSIQVTSSDEVTDMATECSDYSDTESADEVY